MCEIIQFTVSLMTILKIMKMDEARKHYFERGSPDTERQLSHVLTHNLFLNVKQRKPTYK